MSEQLTLAAETREQVGKGASRSLRREGRVPAVIYGNKQDPISIHLEEKELMRALMTGHFMNSTVSITVNGKAALTLPKDVSFHAVTDRPVHVDFLRIGEHTTVHVLVPVVFTVVKLPSASAVNTCDRLALETVSRPALSAPRRNSTSWFSLS